MRQYYKRKFELLFYFCITAIIVKIFCYTNENEEFFDSASIGWNVMSSVERMQLLVDFEIFSIEKFQTRNEPISTPQQTIEFFQQLRTHYNSSYQPYIHHPFNQFHIIRRMATLWTDWFDKDRVCSPDDYESWCWEVYVKFQERIRYLSGKENNSFQLEFPNTVISLIVSKLMYNFTAENYINGEIFGKKTIGMTAYELIEFAGISIMSFDEDSVSLIETLPFWIDTAVKVHSSSLNDDINPKLSTETIVKRIFQQQIFSLRGNLLTAEKIDNIMEIYRNNSISDDSRFFGEDDKNTTLLCSQLNDTVSEIAISFLFCLKLFWSVPYFSFQAEYLSLDPPILIIHNFLTENLTMDLINYGKESSYPAGVINGNSSVLSLARIGQSTGFIREHPLQQKLDFLTEQVAGFRWVVEDRSFSMESATLINYGVSGYYASHWDYILFENETDSREVQWDVSTSGNRLATLMFYLSDVESGGGTIFPKLGISVRPRKLRALLWFNMLDGSPDFRLLHGACPVAIGNKWIGTVWIREFGQEHLRQCSTLHFSRNIPSGKLSPR